ncbi:3458_t:CDS:10 [Diversispora eburnea]|uniref:3458_t:CDS:1 n=1 Tax=Diversispora eburnea TaxID=1213867 RepID=A0A9N9FTF5_9GLOM|nr:3458_t:CDS:10 [Diversispora eburnea]
MSFDKSKSTVKNILFLAIGSMGDVLPFVNLGVGFRRRGYNVIIAANTRFKNLIESNGLKFREMKWDMQYEWQYTEAGRKMVKYSRNSVLGTPTMINFLKQGFLKSYNDAKEVLFDVDFVILGTASHYMYPECLSRNIPVAYICFYPYASSDDFIGACYGQPFDSLQWLPFNIGSKIWKTIDKIAVLWVSSGLLPIYNQRMKDLGGAIEKNHIPVLHASNKNLIQISPNPKNPLEVQIDYPYMTVEEEISGYVPPEDLTNWLNNGNKPIYFGYGSMGSFGNAESRARLWLQVMDLLPEAHRAIFSGVNDVHLPELRNAARSGRVYLIGHVPHAWLFTRVVCVVHHGGAGTTHAVTRAGIPSVVVPHFADQPWWASILHRLGVSPNGGLEVRSLNAETLYKSISEVLTDDKIHDLAEQLGKKINEEHKKTPPILNIVTFIEQYWNQESDVTIDDEIIPDSKSNQVEKLILSKSFEVEKNNHIIVPTVTTVIEKLYLNCIFIGKK